VQIPEIESGFTILRSMQTWFKRDRTDGVREAGTPVLRDPHSQVSEGGLGRRES